MFKFIPTRKTWTCAQTQKPTLMQNKHMRQAPQSVALKNRRSCQKSRTSALQLHRWMHCFRRGGKTASATVVRPKIFRKSFFDLTAGESYWQQTLIDKTSNICTKTPAIDRTTHKILESLWIKKLVFLFFAANFAASLYVNVSTLKDERLARGSTAHCFCETLLSPRKQLKLNFISNSLFVVGTLSKLDVLPDEVREAFVNNGLEGAHFYSFKKLLKNNVLYTSELHEGTRKTKSSCV